MVLRKYKKLIVTIMGVTLLAAMLHHWSDTKTNWKNTVITKLRQYQMELQQSIDFSNFERMVIGNRTTRVIHIKNKHSNNNDNNEVKRRDMEIKVPVTVKDLLQNAKSCLQRVRNQISMYLMRSYEMEFSADHTTSRSTNPILEPDCQKGKDFIIMLTTRPGAFYNRAAIRNAWGRMDSEINRFVMENHRSFKYRTVFIVGRDNDEKIERLLEKEHRTYKDILRLNYKDSYDNLTNKTIQSLTWFANNCPPKYILKTDDDCFVNLVSLVPWLEKLDPNVKYAGKKNEFMPVIRDPTHRNYVPTDQYAEEFYKPYCSGGGYMIKGEVLKNLTDKAKTMRQIINEDAYVGLVMHALGVEPTDENRFLPYVFSKKGINKRTMCNWKANFLMHGVEPEKQIQMHWTRLAMRDYPSICEGYVNVPDPS